jgi:hypothetical protein
LNFVINIKVQYTQRLYFNKSIRSVPDKQLFQAYFDKTDAFVTLRLKKAGMVIGAYFINSCDDLWQTLSLRNI